MVHSIELLFDDHTEVVLRAQGAALAEAGLPAPAGVRAAAHRPHVTLAVARWIDHAADRDLARLADRLPLSCTVGAPVLFGSGRYVLARVIVASRELLDLHAAVYETVRPHMVPHPEPHTAPDNGRRTRRCAGGSVPPTPVGRWRPCVDSGAICRAASSRCGIGTASAASSTSWADPPASTFRSPLPPLRAATNSHGIGRGDAISRLLAERPRSASGRRRRARPHRQPVGQARPARIRTGTRTGTLRRRIARQRPVEHRRSGGSTPAASHWSRDCSSAVKPST